MMIQDRNAAFKPAAAVRERDVYFAAVPADLLDDDSTIIEELIGFAFDTLGGGVWTCACTMGNACTL